MARLPNPGGDKGTWGDILNDYLSQSHKGDGTLKDDVVGSSQLQDNSVTNGAIAPNSVTSASLATDAVNSAAIADGSVAEAHLASAVQTKLDKADSALQTAPVTKVNNQTGDVTLDKTDVGLGNVDNTADTAKPVSTAQQTELDLKADTSALGALTTAVNARLVAANNLSDLANAVTARTNLGLGNVSNLSPAGLAADPALTAAFGPNIGGTSQTLAKLQTGQNITVTFLGDSGLEGTTATAGNDTASRIKTTLEARFGVTVTKQNRAVSGYTAYWAMNPSIASPTKFSLALGDRADLYVIGFGHNDIRSEVGAAYLPGNGYPQAASQAAVEHMIRRLRIDVPGANIIISNQWPYTGGSVGSNTALLQHGQRMRRLAAAYGCGFIDLYGTLTALGVTGSNPAVDDLYVHPTGDVGAQHPNDEGHRVWAEQITRLLPANVTPLPSLPSLPAPIFGAERYTHRSWQQMTNVPRVVGTNGYRLIGTWAGTEASVPRTSSTAADKIEAHFIGSEAALRIDTGAGQGHVKVEIDGTVYNADLDLSVLSAAQAWLPITGVGVGVHRVLVTILSGSMTVRGVDYLPGLGQRTPYTSGLITYTGTWANAGVDSVHYEGNAKQTTTMNDSVTITFVGTALWISGYRYAASWSIGVTTDGGTESVSDWNSGAGNTSQHGGRMVVSGLEYGRHTVTIRLNQTGRAFQVGTFLAMDERRTDRPTSMRGVALTGDVILTSTTLPAIPSVQLSADDATATAPPYPTSVSTSGFTVAGTAAAKAVWELETGRIAY